MGKCKSCDDGLALYAMDDNGTSVSVEGAGSLACIGHAADDAHWPCLLVPQPGRWYEAARQRALVRGTTPDHQPAR